MGRTVVTFDRDLQSRVEWERGDWESQAVQRTGPGSPANAECSSEEKVNFYSELALS